MDAVASENLHSKIVFYRAGWWLFMLLVVGPAWYLASSVEGLSFLKAVSVIRSGLAGLHFPDFLGTLLAYPVTLLATLIPGSSALAFVVVYMFFSLGAFPIFALFFALIQPPGFRQMKARHDPDWEAKEKEGVVVASKIQPMRFRTFVVFLVLTTLAGEVVFGYNRHPLADNYIGDVYLIDAKNKQIPLHVKMKLDVIDSGLIYDRKPGVTGKALHIVFSGENTKVLKNLGISDQLFEDKQNEQFYAEGTCDIQKSENEGYRGGYIPSGGPLVESYRFKMAKSYGQQAQCPETLLLGVKDFDEMQFAISGISKDYLVVAELRRDSRISFMQRTIMRWRNSNNPNRFWRQFSGI
jgi:hypothetical protein